MITTRILPTALALCALLAPLPAFAAKGNKAAKGAKGDKVERPGRVVRQYDTNSDGVITGAEAEAVEKAYEADKTGPLKQFDTNNDGKIDGAEVALMKARHGKKGDAAGQPGKKKKKNASTAAPTVPAV